MTDVCFGLIGYGLFGAHHARAIEDTAGARLGAIAVKSAASRERAAAAHPNATIVSDYRELLECGEIDVVDVVTPNQTHFEMASAALTAGKHLLLEKPMALSVDDCDQLLQLAEQRQRLVAVGHELRLSSLWGGVRRLIADGAIGDVRHALIELSRFPYRQGAEGWRYDAARVGNWILEEPVHFFDLARWYFTECGDPVSIYAKANSRDESRPELQDNFSCFLNFAGGEYAIVTQTLAAFGHHQTAKITGSKGAIWAHWSAPDARDSSPEFGLRYGLGDDVHTMAFDKPTGELLELADQIAAVADCVRTGAAPPCSGSDGRWSTLLCLAAEASAQQSGLVEIAQFLR